MSLGERAAELARRDLPLAVEILREAIRIPADHVDRPLEEGGDPACGLSNHEGPRLEYLRRRIVEIGAVRDETDVGVDDFGNLWWTVQDPDDGIDEAAKRVVWFDGHTDTVAALRSQWREHLVGVDAYDGLVDAERIDRAALRAELGHLPPEDEWHHLVFGRGSADQLSGVVCQILATRIALELAPEGALRGVVVRAHGTVAEEDNDGGGSRWFLAQALAGATALPDAIVLTEGTGDAVKGALGIYRGQRGRMQIEVTVTGRSAHGSMPAEGLNPLEFGSAILAEAAARHEQGQGFDDDPFLGRGTRTASWASLDTPSDCAVPARFTFRFDRRLTAGEHPEEARADIEGLAAVAAARAAGLDVEVTVPHYDRPTWRGHEPDNPQIYPGWVTPEDHPAVTAAVETYAQVVTPAVPEPAPGGGLRPEARVDRWIFSTDGVGFTVPAGEAAVPAGKGWIDAGDVVHPPMIGFGPGIEQNTHKIGECVDARELRLVAAFLATYPATFAATP